MSTEVNKAFVQQFSDNVIHLAQQKGSRLMKTVMPKRVVGKYAHFDRLGATAMALVSSRHQDTPLTDTPHSRRRVSLNDYVVADLIDEEDEVRMLIDPRNPYAEAMGNSAGRTIDDIIIDAADGNATAVASDDSSSSVAVAHTVDEDFNTANSDIIVEKVVEARRILLSNEVDPSEELYFVLDATSLANMLQETEVSSIDYNSVKALVRGELNTFMGFNFIHSERLNNSSEGFKNCLAYAKSAIGLAVGMEPKVSIDKRPDKRNSTQVMVKLTMGAVRIEEEKLVVVEAYRA